MYSVLIVDDEEDIRRGMANGIDWASWGFQVVGQAENGEAAIAWIEKVHPDVIISDIRMPKMDGVALMQYVHQHYPKIKMIILSGYSDIEYLNMAIKNQVVQYLFKPTDVEEFEEVFRGVKEQLDVAQQQQVELAQLKKSVEANNYLAYSKVLSNMLEGYVGGMEEYQRKQALEKELGLCLKKCRVVVMDTEAVMDTMGDSQYQLKIDIIRYCNGRLAEGSGWFFLHRDQKIVGILNAIDGTTQEMVEEQVQAIQGEIIDIYGVFVLSAVSSVGTGESYLPKLYEAALQAVPATLSQLAGQASKEGNNLVAALKSYLDEQYCSNSVSLEEVAEHFRKSPTYISRVFKKGTGFNFSDYITQKRMERSKGLLQDVSLKVYEVAQMVGYADASNFIKVFRKHCGISPNEYRSLFMKG